MSAVIRQPAWSRIPEQPYYPRCAGWNVQRFREGIQRCTNSTRRAGVMREKKHMRPWIKSLLIIPLLIIPGSRSALAQTSPASPEIYKGPCWDHAMNQMQMDNCAGADLKQADADLNSAYQQLLSKMKEHSVDTTALDAAQHQWLAYRDAQMNAEYPLAPGENPRQKYGSIYPMESAELKALLTWQRTKILQISLDAFNK
jgi:uncharacterized protein YecT (DUF1311 family)